jgi:hypothetical protein
MPYAMNGEYMKSLLLITFLSCALSTGEISGRISERSGNPITGAKVCAESWNCTKSNGDGTFRIQSTLNRKTIWVSRSGYKPVFIAATNSPMNIAMEKASPQEAEWILSQCTDTIKKNGKYLGDGALKVFAPAGTPVYESRDIDFWMARIFFHGSEEEQLWIGTGPTWASPGFPKWPGIVTDLINREIVWSTDESYSINDVRVDIRGNSKDGKFWRFTGNSFDAREYKGVSKEAAEEFDKIIDTLCVGTEKSEGK